MSGGKFSVDISWKGLLHEAPPAYAAQTPHSTIARKEKARFFYLQHIEDWRKSDAAIGAKWAKVFDVASKVMAIVSASFSVLMPLAIFYLPAWVPWGIGIPLILALSYAQFKVKSKVEIYQREKEYVPLFDGFLKQPTVKGLQPTGEADLPATDERLKSDLMMRDELEKRHPASGKELASLANRLGLEVTPYLQQAVAAEQAGQSQIREKWKGVQNLTHDVTAAAREEDLPKFIKKMKEKEALAHEEPHPTARYGPGTVRGSLQAVLQLYRSFCAQFKELDALRKQGEALYNASPDFWAAYAEEAAKVKGVLEQYGNERTAHLDEFVLAPDFASQLVLYNLLDQTRQLKGALEAWIAAHPTKRHEAIRAQLQQYGKEEVLTKEQLKIFAQWIVKHPRGAEQKLIHVSKQLPEGLKSWVEKHPQMRFETVNDVYDRADDVSDHFIAAQAAFALLKVEEKALTTFETEFMTPLKGMITGQSGSSKFTRVLQTAFTKMPAIPFAKEPLPKEESLRVRKVEEIHLNRLLKSIDSQMLFTNRVRKYALRIPLVVLFAIEGIAAIYLSTPWIFWGICVLALVGEGISYFVDRRLQQMERKKQAIKLQHILRDHPEIGVVPGTRLRLDAVKEVQKKYGLEGVRPTWARILTEEPNTLFEDPRTLAEEGSKEADAYLQNTLIHLRSWHVQTQDRAQKKALRAEIKCIEKVLSPQVKEVSPKRVQEEARQERLKAFDQVTRRILYQIKQLAYLQQAEKELQALNQLPQDKRTALEARLQQERANAEASLVRNKTRRDGMLENKKASEIYEMQAQERHLVDLALDKLAQEKIDLQILIRDYEQESRRFASCQALFGDEFIAEPVSQAEIDLMVESLKYDPSEPDQTIDLPALVMQIKQKIRFKWLPGMLDQEMVQLLKIPAGVRLAVATALRQLQILQSNKDYQSKQNVDTNCVVGKQKLNAIEDEIKLLQSRFAALSA
ncbi:hypothetical protein ACFLR2_01195 [Chlamydiota bacterium]